VVATNRPGNFNGVHVLALLNKETRFTLVACSDCPSMQVTLCRLMGEWRVNNKAAGIEMRIMAD
jgi:hypothetical protein